MPADADTSDLITFKPNGLASTAMIATLQGTLKGRDALLAWTLLVLTHTIQFCLTLGSINTYFVSLVQGNSTDFSWGSTFDAHSGKLDVLSHGCLVVVLLLFPFLQLASLLGMTAFSEAAHTFLLLRSLLRARPKLKKAGSWVPGIWVIVAGEAAFVVLVGMIFPMLIFATAAKVALNTNFNFYSLATTALVGKFIMNLDETALQLVETYKWTDASLAGSSVLYVGKAADAACKKLVKRVGLLLSLSELVMIIVMKSAMTVRLLWAVPAMGLVSMLLYEYPFMPMGQWNSLQRLVPLVWSLTFAAVVVIYNVELYDADGALYPLMLASQFPNGSFWG